MSIKKVKYLKATRLVVSKYSIDYTKRDSTTPGVSQCQCVCVTVSDNWGGEGRGVYLYNHFNN